jgi:Zn-dependent peptidase ImmA (M78 family)
MIIKDKIQIMGVIWNIRFEKDPKCPLTDKEKEDDPTLTDYPDGYNEHTIPEIVINSRYSKQIQEVIFFHELTHIIRTMHGFTGIEIDPQDEIFIECEASSWHQIMLQIIEWQKV